MKPIDPQSIDPERLWNDAVGEIPLGEPSAQLQECVRTELKSRQRRKIMRGFALAGVILGGALLWRVTYRPAEFVNTPPAPVPAPVPGPPRTNPGPPIEQTPLVQAPPAPAKLEIQSIPVKEFLRQLPHHGYVTVTNEQGRFLVIVDNSTGESFASRLPDDEPL